jgi:hypothetical protein
MRPRTSGRLCVAKPLPNADAWEVSVAVRTAVSVQELLDMTQEGLDALFSASQPGPLPDGDAAGTAIVKPGTLLADVASKVVHEVAWQGKVFDRKAGELRNKVTPAGVAQIVARVYEGDSWFDGEPCIVLDYSDTSFVAQKIRDEIREVAPRLYLGVVYIGERKTINFALDFNAGAKRQPFVQRLIGRIRSLLRR